MPRNANQSKSSNYSMDFDGTNDVINCGLNAPFNAASTNFSISLWCKSPNSFTDSGNLVESRLSYANPDGIAIEFVTNTMYFRKSGSTFGKTITEWGLNNTNWNHIVYTYDLTLAGNVDKIFVYINGVFLSSAPQAATSQPASTGDFTIGDGLRGNFNGSIDQVSVFDYTLSASQVATLYGSSSTGIGNPMSLSPKPVTYYPLGDNSNPIANAGYPNISVGADSVFDFDGSQAVDVPAVDLGVNGSISIWFNPETGGVADFVLVGEGSQGFDYVVRRSSGVFIIWIGSTFYQFAGFGSNVVTGGWNFFVLTKSAGNVNLYLKNSNGEFSVSRTESNWASASLKFDRIGARTITPINLGFQGEISNFQAWDSVLLPTEITTLYNNGQPLITGPQPQAANLQVWYKLNQHDSYWDLGGNGKWTFNNAAIN